MNAATVTTNFVVVSPAELRELVAEAVKAAMDSTRPAEPRPRSKTEWLTIPKARARYGGSRKLWADAIASGALPAKSRAAQGGRHAFYIRDADAARFIQ